jgi:hypothetical protein
MARIAAVAVVLATLAALAGCAGSASPRNAVARAADRTADAGTARMTIDVDEGGGSTARLAGALDYRADAVRLTVERYELRDANDLGGELTDFEVIVVDGWSYTRGLPFEPVAKGQWVKSEAEGAEDAEDRLGQTVLFGPDRLLDYLRATSDDVREVGREDVRGTPTQHYRAVVDLERVLEGAPAESREELRSELEEKTLPIDVWIDDDGLARRVRLVDHDDEDSATVTVEFYDFGADADIEAPPADQVVADPWKTETEATVTVEPPETVETTD